MESKARSLTPDELFQGLQHDTLATTAPLYVEGMVKKSEGNKKTIQFAPGECDTWIEIPLEVIESVQLLRTVPCKDHSHPFVRLDFKAPTTAEAKIFSSILQGMQSNPQGMQSHRQGMPALRSRQRLYAESNGPVDRWGDPVCGPGTRKRCYPAICPNPSGHGTIWCAECVCEPTFPPDLDVYYRF